ncbi:MULTISPECIES: YhgE/Pip domain-containing protein [unclassified Microbacterium]|uniref:YhgE/Pip domain-containing protein n=1 Tax=unclassified Microbacterium TaxID=2609290 RepID=UPI001DC42019|nr:YhgE/Pip domain-containing protein [Microbacterium sp. Bi121]CAH0211017.1 ESX secretion system protein YueB [Microbacterium sp. Bi121]
MKVPSMIAAELRRLTSTKMGIIALLALMLVPVLYGGLYLWANQDPYAKLSDVPVALVVDDEGAPSASDPDTNVNYGDDVAETLVEGAAFDWQRMDADAAASALQAGDVDFAVTIPSDFSEALTSASGTDPRQAVLKLATNDANNYLASTMGTQAVEKIRATVAEKVGTEAANRLLTGLSDVRASLVEATDGASQLADGAVSAHSGGASLADGTAQLASGSARLADGSAQLADGSRRLADGAHQVADGNARIAAAADRVGDAISQAQSALPQVRADLRQALSDRGLADAEIDEITALLQPLGDRVDAATGQAQTAISQIDQLAAGSATLASSADALAGGAGTLSSGAAELRDGASAANDGAAKLRDGLATLSDGTAELRDGLASGVDQIPASTADQRAAQADTIADPVRITTADDASAEDYGAGLAPFFGALAGWIGIYALFLIVKPVSRRAVTALHSPLRITLAGWLTPALLGALQMVALMGVLTIALGFRFDNFVGALGVLVVASATFTAIILALNIWLGSVGQFLGLVLMVLQLVTAGGTFPWQTLPGPLAALHHVLPMGFVVDAMRQLMYGGDITRALWDLAVLAMWMVGALVLAAIGVTRMTHRRTLRDLQPSLIG